MYRCGTVGCHCAAVVTPNLNAVGSNMEEEANTHVRRDRDFQRKKEDRPAYFVSSLRAGAMVTLLVVRIPDQRQSGCRERVIGTREMIFMRNVCKSLESFGQHM